MPAFNERPWWAQTAILLLIIVGAISAWRSVQMLIPRTYAKPATSEDIRKIYQRAEARDRAMYREKFGDAAADALPSLHHPKQPTPEPATDQ